MFYRKFLLFFFLFSFLLPNLFACLSPEDNQHYTIEESTQLCLGTYRSVSFDITGKNVDFDCQGAKLLGQNERKTAIQIFLKEKIVSFEIVL